MKYDRNEIKHSIVNFLGIEGNQFFEDIKDTYGTVWARIDEDDCCGCNVCGPGHFTWTNEGRQIRNHVLEKFPDIVEELGGDYGDFEEFMYVIVEEIFE
jgi:hypothetical protein